jgi:pimeloyl-ACP methyl ester carboxylesterase
MIDDIALAQAACLDIYNPSADWDQLWNIEGVQAGLRIINGEFILCFEGSHTKEDFARDAETIGLYFPGMGMIHSGFYIGLPALLEAVLAKLPVTARLYVCGHSLGGSRTYQATLWLANNGLKAVKAVGFAPARAGWSDFRDKLLQVGTLLGGYHNHFDLIPDVPPMPFCHPIVLTEIAVPKDPADTDPVFAYHHAPLYFKGVSDLLGAQQ